MERSVERDRYLESIGVEIPPDIELFEKDSEREYDCVLCGELHDEFVFVQVYPIQERLRPTSACLCQDCNNYVKQMLLVNLPHLLDEYIQITDTSKIIDKRYTVGDTKNRILAYSLTGKFPEDTYKRFRHLKTTDYYALDYLHTCPFCNTQTEQGGLIVNVPVHHDSLTISGGAIAICRQCEFDPNLRDVPESTDKSETCATCQRIYHVTKEEKELRVNMKTSGRHMCPSCTHELLTSNNVPDIIEDESYRGQEPPNRFVTKKCMSCSNHFMVDRTILPEILAQSHVINNKLVCTPCLKLKTFNSNDNKVWIEYAPEIFIVVYKEGKYWKYRIYKVLPNRKPVKLFQSKDVKKDCIKTTYIAYAETKKLFESKQLELWKDQ